MSNGLDAFKKRTPSKFFSFGKVPGTTCAGTITEISDQKQATKYNRDPRAPKELDFWKSGDPVMEVWITVQTNERDPMDPEDTGSRTVVVTVNQKPGGQLAAIMDACEAVGAETPLPGGFLALSFIGYDPNSDNPDNPRKLYQAKYQAPAPGGGAFTPAPQAAPVQQAPAAQYNQWNPAPEAQPAGAPPAWATAPQAAPVQQAPAAQQYQPPVQVNPNTGEVAEPAAAPAPVAAPAPAAAPAAAPGGWDATKVQSLIAASMDDATINQVTGAPLQAIAAIRAIS